MGSTVMGTFGGETDRKLLKLGYQVSPSAEICRHTNCNFILDI
jgi:hypothetical protein